MKDTVLLGGLVKKLEKVGPIVQSINGKLANIKTVVNENAIRMEYLDFNVENCSKNLKWWPHNRYR